MAYNRSRAVTRAWSLLRLALLWARRGGILKCRLVAELRHFPKHLKALHRHSSGSRRLDPIGYAELELSFDETPVVRLGMIRPASLRFKMPSIPCIRPSVADFQYDFGDEDEIYGEDENSDCSYEDGDVVEGEEVASDAGIDERADEFIARFYRQMKLQRQVSYLEYEEMLNRGAS